MYKKIILVLCLCLFSACSDWDFNWNFLDGGKDNFIETYKEILIVREKYPDTSKTNKEVIKIYEKHEYTEQSFREDFFKFAKDKEEFIEMIDTARERAKRELLELEKTKK